MPEESESALRGRYTTLSTMLKALVEENTDTNGDEVRLHQITGEMRQIEIKLEERSRRRGSRKSA